MAASKRSCRLTYGLRVAREQSPRCQEWHSSGLQTPQELAANRTAGSTECRTWYPANMRSDGSEIGIYTTNMATPAANIATVVIATRIHPKRELGWPCISFLSEATTKIATRRKGANSPLMTAVQ